MPVYPAPPESIIKEGLFIQPIAPIGGSLIGSFFVGVIPLIIVLVALGVFRLPAHYSSLSGLTVCIIIAIFGWQMPPAQAFESIGNGIVFANWPIMWIVANSMLVYNIAIRSGVFDLFRKWMLSSVPADKRVILVVISFSFGALLEGVSGFGAPGAICASMLVSLGFAPMDAIVFTMICNTTAVAYGGAGTPVTTLAALTGLPVLPLSAMMGRQLPFISVFLPFYVLGFYAGIRPGLIECWPMALVAGVSFALMQAIFANFVGPELPDLIGGLVSLVSVIVFVQYWKPPYRKEFEANLNVKFNADSEKEEHKSVEQVRYKNNDSESQITQQQSMETTSIEKLTWSETLMAWGPWLSIVVFVIVWSFAKVQKYGQLNVEWPHLHHKVWLTLYNKKYDAVWVFQPLGTGTAICFSGLFFSTILVIRGAKLQVFWLALKDTFKQVYKPVITVSCIMAFAYLLNYSGIVYTIGFQLASVGKAFPFVSAWLGWIACFLSGSDTSANSLFGNLQVVTAREIGLSAILMAATNSSSAVTSKMISPQNLTTGVSTIGMQGQEGHILRRTILHSIGMCCVMGVMACIQQYLIPGIIPAE